MSLGFGDGRVEDRAEQDTHGEATEMCQTVDSIRSANQHSPARMWAAWMLPGAGMVRRKWETYM